MSYNSGSNRARNFKSASPFALVRFWSYSRDYSLNCTPLGPITITNHTRDEQIVMITLMITDRIGLHSVLLPLLNVVLQCHKKLEKSLSWKFRSGLCSGYGQGGLEALPIMHCEWTILSTAACHVTSYLWVAVIAFMKKRRVATSYRVFALKKDARNTPFDLWHAVKCKRPFAKSVSWLALDLPAVTEIIFINLELFLVCSFMKLLTWIVLVWSMRVVPQTSRCNALFVGSLTDFFSLLTTLSAYFKHHVSSN